ncbi:MAG: hypothetical protein V2A74_02060 [bacterium]
MMSEIHTLQEFMSHTKSISYLIAVVFMVGFIFFWNFLTAKEDRKHER